MIFRQLTSKSLNRRATQRSIEFENLHCSSNGHQLFDKDTHFPEKEVSESDRVTYLPKKNLFDEGTHPEFLPFQHAKDAYLPKKKLCDEVAQSEFLPFQHSMLAYSRSNNHREVLRIFKKQIQCDFINAINAVTLAVALKACRGEPRIGHHIHGFSIASGLVSNLSVSNALMSMYCKSGQFNQALSIFEKLKNPDIVSCNTVLSGFENIGDTLEFTRQMNLTGMVFDAVTYSTVLARCADNEEFLFGIQLHSLELKCGLGCEVFIGNALITMYCQRGRILEAERVFDEMPKKDLVSWNAMLSGYAQEGNYGRKAIWACLEMVRRVMKLDHVSLTSIVSVCGQERNLELGRQIHSLAIKRGYAARRDYVNHVSVCNVLMSLYSKCEAANDAALVFESMTDRNVISWTTMISTDEENAMSLFNGMRSDGVYPNEVTFIALIHAITICNSVEEGRPVHGFCLKSNFLSKMDVANSFITMYAEFKSMEDSKKIFEELKYRGTVSWNALISGYSQNGMGQEALQTFFLAVLESLPNEFTIGSILSAVGATEAISLKHGQRCHSYIIKLGLNDPVVLGALLDMYAKRGSISESLGVFHEMPERSQVAWTAIISAYARHGDYDSVMSLFEEMEKRGVRPDSITFLSLLTACSRKGMVDMGKQIFDSMAKNHLIEPSGLHYSCMVDMLGRAGRLKEAEELVGQIPGGPGFSVLQSLLGASRIYGNVEMGKRAADALMELKPEESGSYVLMSNLYAERGDWEKVAKIRRGMRDRGVRKEVGFSWVDAGEANGSLPLHGFSSDDKSHPKTEEIYMMAEYVGLEMKFLQRERERRGESL